jgi:hypothetical protein
VENLQQIQDTWAQINKLDEQRERLKYDIIQRSTEFADVSFVPRKATAADKEAREQIKALEEQIVALRQQVNALCLPAIKRLGLALYENFRTQHAPGPTCQTTLVEVEPNAVHSDRYRHIVNSAAESAHPETVHVVFQRYSTGDQEERIAYDEIHDLMFIVKRG